MPCRICLSIVLVFATAAPARADDSLPQPTSPDETAGPRTQAELTSEAGIPFEAETASSDRPALAQVDRPLVPRGHFDTRVGLGLATRDSALVAHMFDVNPPLSLVGHLAFAYGITDRIQFSLPAVIAGRVGHDADLAFVPWAGVLGFEFGYSNVEGTIAGLTLGCGFRLDARVDDRMTVMLDLGSVVIGRNASKFDFDRSWELRLAVGMRRSVSSRVDVGFGFQVRQRILENGESAFHDGGTLEVGSLDRGGRTLPLVRVHLSERIALDLHGQVIYSFGTERWDEAFLVGASFVWPGRAARRRASMRASSPNPT